MSHIHESYGKRMRHVTHEWVMSHIWRRQFCLALSDVLCSHSFTSQIHESCHTWMSHATHEWVMPHMNESYHKYEGDSFVLHSPMYFTHTFWRHIFMSHVAREWVMSHMNESCYTWMSHVTHEKETVRSCTLRLVVLASCCFTCEWDMSHVNETCRTWMSHVAREWVMSHVNESYHT